MYYIITIYCTPTGAQTVTPERAFAVNNGTVTLSCPADSTSWLRYNGNDLTPVIAGDGVVLRGAELIIEGFHAHTHAGKYYCIATSNGMTTVSCPAEIIHARKMLHLKSKLHICKYMFVVIQAFKHRHSRLILSILLSM